MTSIKTVLKHSKRHFEKKDTVPAVELKNLLIDFGGTVAVNNINVKINKGELVTLLGPSGCGKTTTLNAIAGLLTPISGKILFKGKDVTKLPPQKRKLGLVFQNYALYPHMSVYKNIAFPLMNDESWRSGVNKRNQIAQLKINKIILAANGAKKAEVDKLEERFFSSYDVVRETEFYKNKIASKGQEDFFTAKAHYKLVKPHYIAKKKEINEWALKKLDKSNKNKELISALKIELKTKLEKAKEHYEKQLEISKLKLKETKESFEAEGFPEKMKQAKIISKQTVKEAKTLYKNSFKELVKKYSLKTENLSEKQKELISEEKVKILKLKEVIHNAVMEVAEKVDIVKNLQKFPTKLSGGQQQRVAIARGIVKNPDILLMDEPLSNLDAKLRIQTRNWIRNIQQELGITLIFVTHDQEEAMAISDKIICLNDGDIQQEGSPLNLYNKPANEFVAKFLGMPEMKIVKAEVTKTGIVKLLNKQICKVDPKFKDINIGVRAEDFVEKSKGMISGTIDDVEYLGKEIRATIDFSLFGKTSAILSKKDSYNKGDTVSFDINLKNINIFNRKTGKRIDV